jgi:hypothetical protein
MSSKSWKNTKKNQETRNNNQANIKLQITKNGLIVVPRISLEQKIW